MASSEKELCRAEDKADRAKTHAQEVTYRAACNGRSASARTESKRAWVIADKAKHYAASCRERIQLRGKNEAI